MVDTLSDIHPTTRQDFSFSRNDRLRGNDKPVGRFFACCLVRSSRFICYLKETPPATLTVLRIREPAENFRRALVQNQFWTPTILN
jgi:hypothetical protein